MTASLTIYRRAFRAMHSSSTLSSEVDGISTDKWDEQVFRYVAVPNGPKMVAEVFARYEMQYVGLPLVA